jgi:hypothetical protein
MCEEVRSKVQQQVPQLSYGLERVLFKYVVPSTTLFFNL